MMRFLAGAGACLLLVTGAVLLWQGQAETALLPDAPAGKASTPSMLISSVTSKAPEATAKSREEKRFSRADKDKDGRIEREEIFGARRKAYAKLDADHNGSLSFDEWAVKTVDKFGGADKDRSGWLTAAEYASTAPPPPKHVRCSC